MGTIMIDLPLTMICRSQIQINPLTTEVINDNPSQSPRFCLSLFILLIPYGYLLYQYIVSMGIIQRKNLYHELDKLDMSIIAVSMLRLCTLFLFPIMDHATGMLLLALFGFVWQMIVLFIFIKFIMDNERIWRHVCVGVCGVYLLYWIILNYASNGEQHNKTIIPLAVPMLIITLSITAIAGQQLLLIHNSLNQNILTPTITIQLKNRRSFIFMILVCQWLSLIMKSYPNIFKPLQGVVLYFLVCQWLSMAIIFRCVLDRIVRSNDEEEQQQQGWGTRNSGLIVVEMQNYGNK